MAVPIHDIAHQEVILSGSLVTAPPVVNGDVVAVHFAQLGSVTVRFA